MEILSKENIKPKTERPKHKGGAPRKRVKREQDIRVRLTATERFHIESKSKSAGMRISDWFRTAAKAARVVPRLNPEDRSILHMLAGMANNLNQLTKLAHVGGILSLAKKCNELLNEIDEAIKYFNKMIGKIPKPGKSFKGCIEYNLLKKDAIILMADGIRIDSVAHTINDFNMQRKMNPGLGQAVGHMILSWSINDNTKLNDDVMVSIAKEYLQKMNINDTQFLIVRHQDKEHPHLHIIYNRVDNNGKTISDNFQHLKNVKIAKELTLKYGFYIAGDKKMVNRQQLKGTDKTKYELFDVITAITKQVKSIDELKRQLLSKGIEIQFKYKSGTKEVQGVSFSKGDAKFKGSEIDRSLSYGRICKTIDQNVQYEKTEHERHQRFVSDIKEAIKSQPVHKQQRYYTGKGASLLETLLQPEQVNPMPQIADDTDERRRKRRKQQSQGISR